MKGELITVETDDHLILHGMHCIPPRLASPRAIVLHVHGIYGNFYENTFLDVLTEAYNEIGMAFLPFNTRGHDYFANVRTYMQGIYGCKRIGAALDTFQDCDRDLHAWFNFAQARGYERIILQGHSLGAMKAVYYFKSHPDFTSAIMLLSPPDHLGLQRARAGDLQAGFLKTATELSQTNEHALMPASAYFDTISAHTFLSFFSNPEDTGMFDYENVPLMRKAGLGSITCPMFVTFGTVQEAITHPLDICISAIREAAGRPDLVEGKAVDGANHLYHFRERRLASILVDWLNRTLK